MNIENNTHDTQTANESNGRKEPVLDGNNTQEPVLDSNSNGRKEPVLNTNYSDTAHASGNGVDIDLDYNNPNKKDDFDDSHESENSYKHNVLNEHNVSNDNNGYNEPIEVIDTNESNLVEKPLKSHESGAENTEVDENQADNQEPIANETPEIIKPKDTTLDTSVKRLSGNGKLRFAAIGTVATLLLLGGGGYLLFSGVSSEPEQVTLGDVNVPQTKAAASAIVTPEQAEYIRQQQIAAGESAEKSGDTYISPFVTVADNNQEELAPPTQPGLKGPEIPNNYTFKDKDGKTYTAEQAALLQQQGIRIQGVTEGAGSIADPYLMNSARTSNSAKTGGNKVEDAQARTAYEPYQVKPYVPNSIVDSNVQNEVVAAESAALDESKKGVDDWQTQYLNMRLKKANLVNQKAQFAFVEQVGELEKTVKPTPEHRANKLGTFNRNYYAVPVAPAPTTTNQARPQQANITSEAKPIIYAGETYRAILRNEVNTDNGKEVIAVLQGGPLKGSTLMGTVVPTNNNIQFNFTRLLRKGKPEINISATARQIGTNSAGMADDIKKHYLVRYSALVASSALSGVGKSYEQTSGANATVTGSGAVVTSATDPTNNRVLGNAVGELGSEISNEVKDLTKKPPTYITNSGKVFNVFFNQNVQDEKAAGKKY